MFDNWSNTDKFNVIELFAVTVLFAGDSCVKLGVVESIVNFCIEEFCSSFIKYIPLGKSSILTVTLYSPGDRFCAINNVLALPSKS